MRHQRTLELFTGRMGGATMTKYLLLLPVLAFALWYLLVAGDDCGDNGYLEDGQCVYE